MNHGPPELVMAEGALAVAMAFQEASGVQEVCGLLAVDVHGTQHFLALTNRSCEPDRFETSAAEERTLRSVAAKRTWLIVAFVHTHLVGGTSMSAYDVRAFHRDGLPWVILAVTGAGVLQRTYPRPVIGSIHLCASEPGREG